MSDTDYMSTAQVAAALGLGVTTIKRWVDEGILPAHRTAGGHRKLLVADVLRVARQHGLPKQELLAGGPCHDLTDVADLNHRFYDALKRGEAEAARELVQGVCQQGLPMDVLADQVIAPAMHRFGQDWEKGKIDVYHEHAATLICAGALLTLIARLTPTAAGNRPRALGGAPEKDPFLLTSLLAELVLRDCGWDVRNLGPNTPLASFRQALVDLRPQLLWLTVSHLEDKEQFLTEYRLLYQEAQRMGVPVAVGGQALTESVRANMPYTTFGDHFAHLAAFGRALYPGQKPPQRGRPPRSDSP